MNIGDVRSLVNALVLGANNMGQDTIVIKGNNQWKISKEIILDCIDSDSDIKVLYHEFRPDIMHDAFEPFLGWIKQLYEESDCDSPEEFMEECQVYALHREMFCEYIRTGECKRVEPVIIIEKDYDLKRLFGSVTNILQNCADYRKILIVLERIHFAGHSTIQYLNELICNIEVVNISLLCTYDNANGVLNYMSNIWDEFTYNVEENNIGIAMYSKEDEVVSFDIEKDCFTINHNDYEKYIIQLRNMFETLAIDQMMYYLGIIYNKIKVEQSEVSIDIKVEMYKLYALAFVYADKYQSALMICDDIKNLNIDDKVIEYERTRIMSLAQIYSGQGMSSVVLAKKCYSLAIELHDENRMFRAKLLRAIALMRGFVNVVFELECVAEYINDKFLEEIESYEYYNHLAYFCIYSFEQKKEYYIGDNVDSNLKYFNRGLEIVKRLENDKFLMGAYKKCAMLYSVAGNIEEVDKNYKKCIDVLRRLNGREEVADIFNGLGYNRMVREDFEQANIYYNQALEIFYAECNPEMVSETFYNMSVNALMAEDYRKSCICITTAIQLLDNYGVYKPRVCHRAKLYGIAALCKFKLGNGSKAQIYIEKVERIIRHIIFPDKEPCYDMWDDELFYYYHIKALTYRKEGRLEDALKCFEQSEFHMRRSQGSMFITYSMLAIEKSELLKEIGNEEERQKILSECLEFSLEIENEYTVNKIKNLMSDKKAKRTVFALDINVDIEDTLLMAKRLGAEKEIVIKNENMEFLSKWQDMFLVETDDETELINRAMTTLQNNFCLDKLLFIDVDEKNNRTVKYINKEEHITDEKVNEIVEYFQERRSRFVVSRVDSEFDEHRDLISIFGINQVVSIIAIPIFVKEKIKNVFITYQVMHENFVGMEIMLTDADLYIVGFAFRQLMNEIYRANARAKIADMNRELKAKNMMLENLAHTDNLTGLLNRQGFNKIVDEKLDNSGNGLDIEKYLTVMYIDLDNFKYCNDNFGHDVGDMVLKEFSNMFTSIIGKSGYVVRYGGDEFVIVVENVNKKYGEDVAEAIFEELSDNNAFADKINESIGRSIIVADENKLSCSIGIAVDDSRNVSMISELLKRADEALYNVKRSTKHSYSVWQKEG